MRSPKVGPVLMFALATAIALPTFAVNLVTNPSFAGNTTGWVTSADTVFDAVNDATGLPGSGSAMSTFVASAASTELSLDQCIAAGPGNYTLGGKILIPSGQAVGGAGVITVSFFSGANCTSGFINFSSLSTSTTGSFTTLSGPIVAPAGTSHIWITGQNHASGAGTHVVNFDDFVLDNGVAADLAVTKSGPATIGGGNNISYSITVINNGPSDAQSVTLSDATPANTTFVSETQNSGPPFTCTAPALGGTGTVSCTLGTLAAGASASFTLVDKVGASVAGGTVLTNTANVSSSTADPTAGNNSASTAATVTTSADLAVTKSGPATIGGGNNISYSITVINNGPSDAQSVTLSDATPANTTFVSETQNSGPPFTCTAPAAGGTGTVSCTLGTLAAGASASFSMVDQVGVSTLGGTTITNTAGVTSITPDAVAGNNSATATTTTIPGTVDLSVTKTTSSPPYGTGLPVTYTIGVHNAGPSPAMSVAVTDPIPAGTTFVSATPTQGSCSGTATVICALGTMASGGSASIALTVTLPATPGTVSNTASVSSSNPDTNAANDSATAAVTVIPTAQIPALSPLLLLLLAAAMGMIGLLAAKG